MESLSIILDATGEPVSVGEIREHLRIDSTREDRLLESYTKAAVSYGENHTKRDFMEKTRKLVLDNFKTIIELPRPPLSTAASNVLIEYTNTTGGAGICVKSSISTCNYVVDYNSEPGRIILGYGYTWPDVQPIKNAVQITYKTGYANDTVSSNVTTPEPIKQWIKVRVGQMHQFREPVIVGETLRYMRRDFVDGMLDPYLIISHESGQI